MRKLIISILLAGVSASPALAQDHGRWHHDQAQSSDQQSSDERSQAREQRSEMRQQMRDERSNGGGNAERMQQTQQQPPRQFETRQQVDQQGQRGAWGQSRFEGRGNVAPQQVVGEQPNRGDRGRYTGTPQAIDQQPYRGDRARYPGNPRQVVDEQLYRGDRGRYPGGSQQEDPARIGSGPRDRGNWSQGRDGEFRQRQAEQQRYQGNRQWGNGGWNRDWRSDRRYDWRSYRNNHRSVFHLGIYYDPFGYGYQPFGIGYDLAPYYYGQQYWINPAQYALPFPPAGTAWVRYWNDAVLVDLYSGQVVDVIHNFFW